MSNAQIIPGGNPAVVAPIFPQVELVQSLPFPNPATGPSGLKPGLAVIIGNGTWAKADNTDGTHANPRGLVGPDNLTVQSAGRLKLTTAQWDAVTGGSGGLVPKALYYLGTGGGITTTIPVASGSFSSIVGVADSDDTMEVRLFAGNGPHA